MTKTFQFKGIDYEEISIAITGNEVPDDMDEVKWVTQFINHEENVHFFREFLRAHIDHIKQCGNKGREDNIPVYEAVLAMEDGFNFLQVFTCLLGIMWC